MLERCGVGTNRDPRDSVVPRLPSLAKRFIRFEGAPVARPYDNSGRGATGVMATPCECGFHGACPVIIVQGSARQPKSTSNASINSSSEREALCPASTTCACPCNSPSSFQVLVMMLI